MTSAVEAFATEMSTTSLTSKTMLWSAPDPRNGLVASLTPFVRCRSCLEGRWTIFSTNDDSLVSRVDEEKIPEYLSPFLVVTVAISPYNESA